jgi:hypothetical protein
VIDLLDWIEVRIDPWPPFPRPPLPDPPPWLDIVELETVALGGAVHALVEAFGKELEPQPILDRRSKEVEAVARKGAASAVSEWAAHYAKAADHASRLARLAERQM